IALPEAWPVAMSRGDFTAAAGWFCFSFDCFSLVCATATSDKHANPNTVILFSFVKNKGDTLFKEASDELQWYVRYGNHDIVSMPYVSAAPAAPERPQIRTRIVLREYARATVLPLLSSSEYGVAIYIGVNIMLLISYPVLSRFAMLK